MGPGSGPSGGNLGPSGGRGQMPGPSGGLNFGGPSTSGSAYLGPSGTHMGTSGGSSEFVFSGPRGGGYGPSGGWSNRWGPNTGERHSQQHSYGSGGVGYREHSMPSGGRHYVNANNGEVPINVDQPRNEELDRPHHILEPPVGGGEEPAVIVNHPHPEQPFPEDIEYIDDYEDVDVETHVPYPPALPYMPMAPMPMMPVMPVLQVALMPVAMATYMPMAPMAYPQPYMGPEEVEEIEEVDEWEHSAVEPLPTFNPGPPYIPPATPPPRPQPTSIPAGTMAMHSGGINYTSGGGLGAQQQPFYTVHSGGWVSGHSGGWVSGHSGGQPFYATHSGGWIGGHSGGQRLPYVSQPSGGISNLGIGFGMPGTMPPGPRHGRKTAFVTLLTNDGYVPGAMALGQSLREAGTQHSIVVMVTGQVSGAARHQLLRVWDAIEQVEHMESHDEHGLRLLARPELGVTFTKIAVWNLAPAYEKCVFLDSDTVVLSNVDELMERQELSAAADCGWPDTFNSGVFVLKPSKETYERLKKFAVEKGSFDGGDQGLLNRFFPNWHRLPFVYNCNTGAFIHRMKSGETDYKKAKVLHFLGQNKPWHWPCERYQKETANPDADVCSLLSLWWDFYDRAIA